MSFDPSRQATSSSSFSNLPNLKRSYAQRALAVDNSAAAASSSSHRKTFNLRPQSPPQPPHKVPRLEKSMPPRFNAPQPDANGRQDAAPDASGRKGKGKQTQDFSSRGSFGRSDRFFGKSSRGGSSKGLRRDLAKKEHRRDLPTFTEPLFTEDYITATAKQKPIKPGWEENCKSMIANWCSARDLKPQYDFNEGYGPDGKIMWRCKLTLSYEGESIVGYGDDLKMRAAEKLAALHALYQLDAKGTTISPKKPKATLEAVLPDGSSVGFERARQFMDYYCRRFGFGKPDITYADHRNNSWEAVMTVGGKRIGMGKGGNKKDALQSCYVDVTVYLESCDPDLWKKFVEDAKTGKDLGLAPAVNLQVDERLEDQIQTLCADVKRSLLYKNRPRLTALMTGDDDPATMEERKPEVPLYVPPRRRRATEQTLERKSQELLERRQKYTMDPKMEKMRRTRAALPVFTKAQAVLDHVRENDVTICMAATGSGKTTQLPQMILDEYIERGEGAKCNIFCTQPRRLAAISVANRVAAERGERTGQSIGYQVRFEHKIPEAHGSITFCTIGTFLRRMQNDLLDNSSADRLLDDVTHLVVDEVHERDVDTDLLLVVLKRLLADRKARGKPIKIVLMSATIDPKLFQEYFPDEHGKPAGVVEVPGRSFPVQKHFLDEFLPDVVRSADPAASWVMRDDPVKRYLNSELDPVSLFAILGTNAAFRGPPKRADEDLDVPPPLIALTIAHVLRNSDEGHVLVFLPGWEDISNVQKVLRNSPLGLDFNDSNKFSIHCLHSSIPVAEQQVIFDPPPAGQRRIILSTNIAETSVTIPDVVYVVDTAKLKEQRYNPDKHISALVSSPVGKSNLNQRAGRAGRHRPGEYYGLLTKKRADALETHQTVEIKRVDLSNVVMHVKALDFPHMTVEEVLAATIEPPAVDRVESAMKSLQMVGALDTNKQLTSLGRVLLQLPLDVQMGRLLLYGAFLKCLDPALTLAAMLTARDPFLSPLHLKAEASACKNSFTPDEYRSDAIAMLRAYNAWWEKQSKEMYMSANSFCVDNFLSKPTLMQVAPIKSQLLQNLYDIGIVDVCAGGSLPAEPPRNSRGHIEVPAELNANAESLPVLAALISIGLQPKFAIRTGDRSLRTVSDKLVFIHPTSVNNRKRLSPTAPHQEKELIAYVEKRQNLTVAAQATPSIYLVTTTRLDPLTYILFGAYHLEVTRRGLECDQWLPVVGNVDCLDDLERLKVLMESCMLRVFQGIIKAQTKRHSRFRPVRRDERENESGDEDEDAVADSALTPTEIRELDYMTTDIVRILDNYNEFRVANQSRHNSRPGTPMGSPLWPSGRLPPIGSSRSGYSTPRSNGPSGLSYYSRPSTPSRLR